VLLPASGVAHEAKHEAPVARRMAGTNQTILLIEDDEIIRPATSRALERLGYAVVAAGNGLHGVELFRSLADTIGIVILDLSMPGISGEETLRRLQEVQAEVPIVLSSGFSGTEALRQFSGRGVAGFLQKPYTVKTLAHHVEAALANRSGV
jgi:DNA-binding NtrC family response regulator